MMGVGCNGMMQCGPRARHRSAITSRIRRASRQHSIVCENRDKRTVRGGGRSRRGRKAPRGEDDATGDRGVGSGRAWHSPLDSNLYLSVLLRPRIAVADAPLLTLVTGLADDGALLVERDGGTLTAVRAGEITE